MKILALEFSSPRRSVAVVEAHCRRGELSEPQTNSGTRVTRPSEVLAEVAEGAGQNIPPLRLVEQALAAAKLTREHIECIAVGLGPGSYTGIRGAIALAQGWQLASGVKVAGVSTVDVLMADVAEAGLKGRIAAVFDAQRGEFYVSEHSIDSVTIKKTGVLRIITLKEIEALRKAQTMVAGPEVRRWFPTGWVVFPSAASVGRLAGAAGKFVSARGLEPIYLRESSFIKAPAPRNIPTL